MKYLQIFTAIIFVVFMLGCSSVSVQSDYDPEYDFSKFKTYRWASAKEINPNDELVKFPLVYKRVQESVDRVLQQKGMTKVEGDQFDVVVIAHAGSKERMQVHQTGGYGAYHGWYEPWWGAYGGSTHVSYYEEATLVIDIVSWKNKELAWRGLATGTVEEHKNVASMQKRIDNVVDQIFANYPPGMNKK